MPVGLLVLYVCLFHGLGALGILGPDEPRYAAIAQAMSQNHDWVTPRLWGAPWFEKPILYYWTAALAMRLFGATEFAARLPSALAALLAVLAAFWSALRCYGLEAGWFLLLMLPASVGMIGFARAAGPDMLFAALLTATLAMALEMLQMPHRSTALEILFGFFLGAAVLAKGPAAVILAGVATLLWALLAREWRAALQFLRPWVIAAFCATALPWYLLCALRNPDFLRVFIWQHNFERYLTPVFEHPEPFWFFAFILSIAALPWTITLCAPLLRRRTGAWRDSPGLLIACWGIFPVLFFSFSQSKLPGYILPAIPPMFILGARSLALLIQRAVGVAKILLGMTGIAAAAFTIVARGTVGKAATKYHIPQGPTHTFITVLWLGGAVVAFLGFCKHQRGAALLIAALIAALVAFANVAILPSLDVRISPRTVAEECLRQAPAAGDVGVYGLNRNWTYGLDYYFGRELPEWHPGVRLPEWLFTSEDGARKIRQMGLAAQQPSSVGAPAAVLLHISNPQ